MMLKKIIIVLQKEWLQQTKNLKKRMQQAGIVCVEGKADLRDGQIAAVRLAICQEPDKGKTTDETANADETKNTVRETGSPDSETLLITDSPVAAVWWKQQGGVCVGCTAEEHFFEGAGLVTDCLEELNAEILEETLLHALGLPVTAAVTERLILREIEEGDIELLYKISCRAGMEHLWEKNNEIAACKDAAGENPFCPERMLSYIKSAYRIYGYGLWSVWTKEGRLIGCCGLSGTCPGEGLKNAEEGRLIGCCGLSDTCPGEGLKNTEEGRMLPGVKEYLTDENRVSKEGQLLYLQYMLDPDCQSRGYGTEMCRAALEYAFTRLDCSEVRVRIHPDNKRSLRLAKRLGFMF